MPSANDVSVPVKLQQPSAIESPSLITYFFVVWGSICSQGTPSHLLHVYMNTRTNLDQSGGRPQTAISASTINRKVCLQNNKRNRGTVQQFKFLLTVLSTYSVRKRHIFTSKSTISATLLMKQKQNSATSFLLLVFKRAFDDLLQCLG